MKRILLLAVLMMILTAVSAASGEAAPEWADADLNGRGFLDEGEYLLEDPENGRWMYVNETLRIQITRTWETPEKPGKGTLSRNSTASRRKSGATRRRASFP